jgi:hypothetical protein
LLGVEPKPKTCYYAIVKGGFVMELYYYVMAIVMALLFCSSVNVVYRSVPAGPGHRSRKMSGFVAAIIHAGLIGAAALAAFWHSLAWCLFLFGVGTLSFIFVPCGDPKYNTVWKYKFARTAGAVIIAGVLFWLSYPLFSLRR